MSFLQSLISEAVAGFKRGSSAPQSPAAPAVTPKPPFVPIATFTESGVQLVPAAEEIRVNILTNTGTINMWVRE